jgi:hypothetical protein
VPETLASSLAVALSTASEFELASDEGEPDPWISDARLRTIAVIIDRWTTRGFVLAGMRAAPPPMLHPQSIKAPAPAAGRSVTIRA